MTLKQHGFTLIELVISIIILAVIGIATSSYIATALTIYSNTSDQDAALSSSRFAMERLRRDILNALPNSLVVSTDKKCLTFMPIVDVTVYENDMPISPASSTTATIAPFEKEGVINGLTNKNAGIYLLKESDLRTDKVQQFTDVDGTTITFNGDISFSRGSPAKRIYIFDEPKSYYFNTANEFRYADSCNDIGSLMASNIKGEFEVEAPTLQRNGLAKVTFTLDFSGQDVPIEQTLHVNNVP